MKNDFDSKCKTKLVEARVQEYKLFSCMREGRRKKHRISMLQQTYGKSTEFDEKIGAQIVEYYKQLFICSNSEDFIEILEGILQSITRQMNDDLIKSVGEEKIEETFSSINPDKAPVPNDMSPLFF